MKRVLFLLFAVAMLVCMALPFFHAMADEVFGPMPADTAITLPDMFFSWDGIATIPGAVAAVVFLVQVLKLPLDKVWKIPTQAVVFALSIGVLLLAQAFVPSLGGLTWQTGVLCLINGAIVALAAMSTYELTIRTVEQKQYGQQVFTAEAVGSIELNDDEIRKIATETAAAMRAQTAATGASVGGRTGT